MSRQIIDTTTDNGTYKGDPAKVAFEKVNANFDELYQASTAVAALAGKNLLLNCGLPINQRNFGGGALAAGAYGYDMWKAGPGGCNLTINTATGVFTHASGPIQQIVEVPLLAWGRPLTFSVEDPTAAISVSVGGASGSISPGSGRRSVTLTPSGSGNMTVQWSATGATYSRPQLERGSAATQFDARSVADELALCQRYARAGYVSLRHNGSGASGAGTFIATQMRAAPAVTFSNTVYAYGCSAIGSASASNGAGVEIFVSATGAFAFASNYFFDASL